MDIGANIGVMTRLFAARAGHVHAFEPGPRALRLLRANALPNVTVHPVAVSDENGTVRLNEQESSDTSFIDSDGVEVRCVTVDSLGLKPDFIKIDVEGYEHKVIRGAAETLKSASPIVMFEALGDAAREYCEKLILGFNPNYDFEALPSRLNHIAWPK